MAAPEMYPPTLIAVSVIIRLLYEQELHNVCGACCIHRYILSDSMKILEPDAVRNMFVKIGAAIQIPKLM